MAAESGEDHSSIKIRRTRTGASRDATGSALSSNTRNSLADSLFDAPDANLLSMAVDRARDSDEEDSASDSESEDILWTRRRCRLSGQESGDRVRLLLHRGTPVTLPLRSQAASRSRSAPPSALPLNPHLQSFLVDKGGGLFIKVMLSTATTVDLTFDDDDWVAPQASAKLYRAASVGNSWGVTSFGRGFDWKRNDDDHEHPERDRDLRQPSVETNSSNHQHAASTGIAGHAKTWGSFISSSRTSSPVSSTLISAFTPIHSAPPISSSGSFMSGALSRSPVQSRCSSPRPLSPSQISTSFSRSPLMRSQSSPRLDNDSAGPRSRRRSSHQRVSLIAGRVSIVSSRPSSPPPVAPQKLVRSGSAASFLSVASSAGPPTPGADKTPTVGERSISEFVIEGEIGRGAYGLVKRAREMTIDGTLGVRPIFFFAILSQKSLTLSVVRHSHRSS